MYIYIISQDVVVYFQLSFGYYYNTFSTCSCMFYTNFENINRSVVAALIAADENRYSSVMALYAKVFDSGVATIEDIFYYI